MHNIKIAVIGCGHWGKNLVRNFAKLNVLAGVCDEDENLAKKFSQQYEVPVLSLAQTFQNKSISGVVIAAPAIKHAELTRQALEAGKHVFVEKPLALNVDEASSLYEYAKSQKLILMVGHLLQYHLAFLELKKLIENGKVGKVQYVYSNRLNLGKFRTEENILWSFAPHDISMILSIAGGLPESVHATGSCHLNSHVEDITTTYLKFKNGIQAHIFVSWLHPFKEQKLVVIGNKGMIVFNDGNSWDKKLQLYPHKIDWIDGKPSPAKAEVVNIVLKESEPLKCECQHFLDCIDTKQTPRTDGLEGLEVLKVLDAAEKSMHSGKEVFISRQGDDLKYFKHETAVVDECCDIGKDTKIWHFSHILQNTKIGNNCTVGQNVVVGPDVVVGKNCKIQNNVSIYKGVTLEDGVFVCFASQ